MRIRLLPLFIALLLLSCGRSERKQPGGAPWPTKEWATDSPARHGLDSTVLADAVAAIESGRYGTIYSLLIVKDGYLVAENYFNGEDRYTPRSMGIITASITSALVGIAIGRGELEGTEEKIAALLPEYRQQFESDPRKKEITVEHLLTMTAGLESPESEHGTMSPEYMESVFSDSSIGFLLSRPMIGQPGAAYDGNGTSALLLAPILERATGEGVEAYARRHLFGPLGIDTLVWNRFHLGLVNVGWGLNMRPRDLAKIGQLYANGGRWEGKQIMPKEWIERSVQPLVPVNEGDAHGYLWWTIDGGDSLFRTLFPGGIYFSMAPGGQFLVVAPEHRLVVVTTGGNWDEEPITEQMALLIELIVRGLGLDRKIAA